MENSKEIALKEKMEQDLAVVVSPMNNMIQALSQGLDPEKVGQLMEYQERWEATQARKAYHVAMSAFKANAPEIVKDKIVAYKEVKYSHASLYNVTKSISSELSKHGLSASWNSAQNGGITVTCKITHVLGHSEETPLTAQPDASGSKNSIQQIGSTITYLERYTLLMLTGLATSDQDDDGKSTEEVEYIDEKQLGTIRDYIDNNEGFEERLLKYFKIGAIEEMPKDQYGKAIIAMEGK